MPVPKTRRALAVINASEAAIPCFIPGTMIATPRGEVPAQMLRIGDTVVTRDNGIRPIHWVGSRTLSCAELGARPHLRPVLIRKGSLGRGLPEADLLVSPNRRILVSREQTTLHFDAPESLIAAKHVVVGRLVNQIESAGVAYVHFTTVRHEIVLANGVWTESFQPADLTLRGIGNAQRAELLELLPELRPATVLAGRDARRSKSPARHDSFPTAQA